MGGKLVQLQKDPQVASSSANKKLSQLLRGVEGKYKQIVGSYKRGKTGRCAIGAIMSEIYGDDVPEQLISTLLHQDLHARSSVWAHIIRLNDELRMSFSEIADQLEKEGY